MSAEELSRGVSESEVDISKRIDYELVLKRIQGNHWQFKEISFKGIELTRKPEWIKLLCEAIAENTTLTRHVC